MNIHTPQPSTFASTVPALALYCSRIGAAEKNFRRWVVQEKVGNYQREVATIKIAPDGTITCSDKEHEPTDAECAAIKLAFAAGINIPRSIEFRKTALPDLIEVIRQRQREEPIDDGEPRIYEFYNQHTGQLLMVQQRIDTPDGGKSYIPWCYFSDGIFRAMEPDGDLPFWKPERSTGKTKIMVHEGAKAAKSVTDECADANSNHPWIKELRKYEHWGIIGGALNPHRADYNELFARELECMVYACDNDSPGKAAVRIVSKHYRRSMARFDVDQTFPQRWDMADPLPKHAKPMNDYMAACTWATEEFSIPNSTKVGHKVSKHLEKEWMHSVKPPVFVHRDLPRKLLSEDEFNNTVKPFSDVKNTAQLLLESHTSKADTVHFNPSAPSGKVSGTYNDTSINTHMAPEITPEYGDCTPLEVYFQSTFPVKEDRDELMRWCATLTCHPEIKMNYGVLLISETQGVGKSTLGSDIMKPLLGEWNCSEPSEKAVVENKFNSWSSHKRLAIVHEIYAGHNSKAYDELKSIITEATIEIEEKFQPKYVIANWLHVLACSNSLKALKMSREDRRWLVPRVTEEKRSPEVWARLHKWLKEENGYAKTKQYFADWLAANGGPVQRGVDAPMTEAKLDVIKSGLSRGGEFIVETLNRIKEERGTAKPIIVLDVDGQTAIMEQFHAGRADGKLEGQAVVRNAAKADDWFVVKQRVKKAPWKRAMVTMALTTDRSLVELSIDNLQTLVAWDEALFVDVVAEARKWREASPF